MAESTAPEAPTVLVVDDQPEILRTLTRFLNVKGYDVETAASVDEAIPVLAQGRIKAVVLDLRMSPRSGLELLKFIREDETLGELPVVILTGGILTREEQSAIARYQAHVFYKPKSYHALINHLDRLTG